MTWICCNYFIMPRYSFLKLLLKSINKGF